jgi:hypothetical protein
MPLVLERRFARTLKVLQFHVASCNALSAEGF